MGVSGQETVWTVGRLLDWTTAWFSEKDVEGGRLAAELLLARALGCRKIELYTRYDQQPADDQRAAFRELVRRAGEHTPIAYLLGHREFFSLEYAVSPAVLIPRPETEALVQRAIQICRAEPERTFEVLDIGTGSGCVAVSIAKYTQNTRITASDISAEALTVAQTNIARHGLCERVRTVRADLLGLPVEVMPDKGFDLVVSNPPYIAEPVWHRLPAHIRDHEPRIALAAGPDGLDVYRRLAAEAAGALAGGGRLLVEIGHDQSQPVRSLFEARSWSFAGAHRDKTDPHERVLEFFRVTSDE